MSDPEYARMEAAVLPLIEDELGNWCKRPDGTFECELYADYRDEMSNDTAIKILESDDPMQSFFEKLDEWYGDEEYQRRQELKDTIREKLTKEGEEYPDGLNDYEEDLLDGIVYEYIIFSYPEEHFLKQEFYVNIMLDTGDGNYDYTLNSVYPCWYGRYGQTLDDKAGIVWLTRQQGFTKTQLTKALMEGDIAEPKGFLESMRQEIANCASHMMTLTFLVTMTLEQLIELNRLIKLQDRNGHFYDATKNPYCGYIVLDKNTMAGLYDPWGGGGSVLEIELVKDVRIPIRFIRSALPDGGDGYSVESVYGMCGSAWKQGELKLIHSPKSLTA